MSRMSPSLIAQLISEVQKNPMLYDYTDIDYKNFEEKYLVWAAIAKEIGAISGDAVSCKWRHLRDSYGKYKKQLLSTPFDEHGIKTGLIHWKWAPLMSFLDPFMRKRKAFLRADLEHFEESERPTECNKIESPEVSQDLNDTSFCSISSSSKSDKANTFNIISKTSNKNKRKFVEAISEVTDPLSQESSTNRLDMIDYLFLNYAETFKQLSRKRQTLLKLSMAKMFAAAELEELESDPIQLKVLADDSE